MAMRHGVVPIAGLKKKRRVRTFANALDAFEPLAHKAGPPATKCWLRCLPVKTRTASAAT